MSTKPEHERLSLSDIKVNMNIDVIDRFRKQGIHAKVDRIETVDGITSVEFTDTRESIKYKWHATAMGLDPKVTSSWTTYRANRGPDNIYFGSLYKRNSQIA